MKKLLSLCFIALISSVLLAEEVTTSSLVLQMNKAQRDGDYLGALVAATAILKRDNNHRIAKDFVHDNYERMDRQAKTRISEIAFSEDAAELEEVCEIYRKLSDINDNLTEVDMPLRGGNKITGEWVWQPEIQYYRGHYDRARTRVLDLYKSIGKAAIKENNIESAYVYYQKGLNTYLMSDEYPSQLENVVKSCRAEAQEDAKSRKTDELVRSYNTYLLISRLDSTQDVRNEQKMLKELIADGYVRDAEKELNGELVTDWEAAYELYQKSLDWDESPEHVKHVNAESAALRKQIAAYYREHGNEERAKQWEK